MRYFMQSEVKTYLDLKGVSKPEECFRAIEEWKRTHPGRVVWDSKIRGTSDRPGFRGMSGSTRKPGECFSCGKPGHYANECRSKPVREGQTAQYGSGSGQIKREPGTERPIQKSKLSEVTCYNCRQKGHIAPNCPKKNNKVKRVKILEDQIVSLRRNEIFGSVGPHRMPVTCDTGAEVMVVPAECVEPHQKTGETYVLRSFNDIKTTGDCCNVTITVGDVSFTKKAVTQPGADLGWSVCLSLDMADPRESQFLLREMTRRAAMIQEETLYVPPEVREGFLNSGILVQEAQVVKIKKTQLQGDSSQTPRVPLQAATAEAEKTESIQSEEEVVVTGEDTLTQEEEVLEEQGEANILADELILVNDEAESSQVEGSADTEGGRELPVQSIREGMPREAMAEETKSDKSLQAVFKLAELDREGYHLLHGLVFRTRLDIFGKPVEQLCVPTSYRKQCLKTGHTGFGHQGRNRMVALLRPHFYWPCIARDCVDYVKECVRCQEMDKTNPRPPRMTERPIVTRPFSDVAIDIVGPFLTAIIDTVSC